MTAFFATAENRKSAAVQANLGRLVRRYAAEGTAAGYSAAHALLAADYRPTNASHFSKTSTAGWRSGRSGLPPVGQGGLFDTARRARRTEPTRPARSTNRSRPNWPSSSARLASRRTDERTRHPARAAGRHRRGPGPGSRRLASPKTPRAAAPRTTRRSRRTRRRRHASPSCSRCSASSDAEMQKPALARTRPHRRRRTSATAIVTAYPTMPAALQAACPRSALRPQGVGQGVPRARGVAESSPADVPVEQVRLLALLGDKDIDAAVRKHWGSVKPGTPEEKLAEVRRFTNDLRAGTGDATARQGALHQALRRLATSSSARAATSAPT